MPHLGSTELLTAGLSAILGNNVVIAAAGSQHVTPESALSALSLVDFQIHHLIGLGSIGLTAHSIQFSDPPVVVAESDDRKVIKVNPSHFAPKYNYDFRGKNDAGKTYMRGDYEYKRPIGWYRHALNVVDVYEDGNTWLGEAGNRFGSTPGEWPVSYHGTKNDSLESILDTGLVAGRRQLYKGYALGVYTSPSLKVASSKDYATVFAYDGDDYQIVIQTRSNPRPGHLVIVPASVTRKGADYWISPMQNPKAKPPVYDIRPYGILLREL